jgi:hypothetical protein
MSYDINLTINTGKKNVSIFSVNITSNVQRMYNHAFNSSYWVSEIDGKKCKDVEDKIVIAHVDMLMNEHIYNLLAPSNGWGKYEDALRVLTSLRWEVVKHSECIIEISK